ncbi:FAD-dependent oxidoreductase [Aldersonia sp. NBC_00410]|uniref:NAD(P)/FAD-dependent oxidoreductase n=1 Tax=Aldersonia sp. NBC_00410 TaxID=2975954 RepID=UPI00225399C4|nr:FAD-dependent oxidoreductase [Aldersonia sp. NBC_00410]MCX5042227.1 FAD-dependent oxidoreductase [Aldersonia sp. NBC_00410]
MSTHVVIIGAGYAGAGAAKRLLFKNPNLQVTVVNPRTEFVERIRLHQLAVGNREATLPLADALHPKAQLVVGTVTAIDAPEQEVRLANGRTLRYDHLVYAVGSTSRVDHIAGAREHAFPIAEYESASALRTHLAALPAGAPIVVVGGGLTGIETAAELGEQQPGSPVTLISSGPVGDDLTEKARTRIRRVLTSHGVDIVEGATVTRIDTTKIELADGRVLGAECAVIATASGVPALARDSGLPTDAHGRLLVDATLECPEYPGIVGAGDATAIAGGALRMSCQAATPLGAHAADTILRRLDGKAPKPVRPRFVGRAISLGRRDGVIQRTDFLDSPVGTVVGGRVAAMLKEQICVATVSWGVNPRRPVLFTWTR